MPFDPAPWTAQLDRMQYQADPLADDVVAAVLGPWADAAPDAPQALTDHERALAHSALLARLIGQWRTNGQLRDWQPALDDLDTTLPAAEVQRVIRLLQDYLAAACQLPAWADPARLEAAEKLFFDDGPLSVLMLFCASLPQCYVVPDLAEVLHVTGQLERHTEYRIRATGAMIFPVMMRGGMTRPEGMGVAQVLKVRLVHAVIRHLILRGDPQACVARLQGARFAAGAGVVPPLDAAWALEGATGQRMHRALLAHGWRLGEDGLPCNQEEMAYTLLTFGYAALVGLRRLGLGYPQQDEEAMLHAWNVMGHFVGVAPEAMLHTMPDARAAFELMQARGRATAPQPDPRPHLGRTLMVEMARLVPWGPAKGVPQLITRRLCGPATSRDIGLDSPVPWSARLIYVLGGGLILGLDRLLVALFGRGASLVRLITRLLGYRAIGSLLLDQTRPVPLPSHLAGQVGRQVQAWRA
jgi:hypothetical protein